MGIMFTSCRHTCPHSTPPRISHLPLPLHCSFFTLCPLTHSCNCTPHTHHPPLDSNTKQPPTTCLPAYHRPHQNKTTQPLLIQSLLHFTSHASYTTPPSPLILYSPLVQLPTPATPMFHYHPFLTHHSLNYSSQQATRLYHFHPLLYYSIIHSSNTNPPSPAFTPYLLTLSSITHASKQVTHNSITASHSLIHS